MIKKAKIMLSMTLAGIFMFSACPKLMAAESAKGTPFDGFVSTFLINQQHGLYQEEQEGSGENWLTLRGLMGATVLDLDNDGEDELLTIRMGKGEQDSVNEWSGEPMIPMYISVYENEGQQITLADEKPFEPYGGKEMSPSWFIFTSGDASNKSAMVSILDVNGEKKIFNEYKFQADSIEEAYWSLKYDGSSLQYDTSLKESCEDLYNYAACNFDQGQVTDIESKDYIEQGQAGQGIKSYFEKYGITVVDRAMLDLNLSTTESILDMDHEECISFSITNQDGQRAILTDSTMVHADFPR